MNSNPQTLMVIMPVHNSENTLASAIQSILDQSYRNLRLVIVDDCSTDDSLSIARSYLDDERVYVLRNRENLGAYYSRNAGLDFIRNQNWGYFTTHDSDDISYPHRYLKLIRALKQPKNVAVQDVFRKIDYFTGKTLDSSLTMAHAVFKHEVFRRIGFFETVQFGADWEYWQRMNAFLRDSRFSSTAVKETLGDSFIHKNNLTVKIPVSSRPRKEYIKTTREQIAKRIEQRNFYRDFQLNKRITKRVT